MKKLREIKWSKNVPNMFYLDYVGGAWCATISKIYNDNKYIVRFNDDNLEDFNDISKIIDIDKEYNSVEEIIDLIDKSIKLMEKFSSFQ